MTTKKEEFEKVMELLIEVQKCENKREAFLKGALFGLGFIEIPEPHWDLIKKIIQDGKDCSRWLDIEKEVIDMHRKIRQDEINFIESMLKPDECQSMDY